jgi:hypothetical protein
MKDIAIALSVGSPNSSVKLVKRTFDSIKNNIGNCDWKVFICLGLNISSELDEFVKNYVKNDPSHFEVFLNEEVYWAEFINKAIDISSEYKFFIKSHDDIELITPDFYNKLNHALDKINKEVGWVSFTDIGWKFGDFSPPTRDGYYIDVLQENSWVTRKIFQFHFWPEKWTRAGFLDHYIYLFKWKINRILGFSDPKYPKPIKKINKLKPDLPVSPVKSHAPFNHFVLISRKSLEKIGKCENWQTFNALFVDEDWGLRSMELKLPNIWIPEIEYYHQRGIYEGGGTRSWITITKDVKRVEELFYQKWGFHPTPTIEELIYLREKHKDNLIPWSSFRRSWEWDYEI